jgi:hypothetical protein
MKLLLVGTEPYLYKVYNCHDNQACGYKRFRIFSRLDSLVMVYGVVFVELCDLSSSCHNY